MLETPCEGHQTVLQMQAVALTSPPPGLLPPERTKGSAPFEVIGVDFTGPIKYHKSA